MPFIRYAIGDIGIPSDEKCECGITFPTMKLIEGRADSMLTLPGGRILSPRNFAITVNHFEHIYQVDQWRVVQRKIDLFEVYLKLKNNSVKASIIEDKLKHHMYKTLNMNEDMLTFIITVVEDMPKDSTGKLRSIVSLI